MGQAPIDATLHGLMEPTRDIGGSAPIVSRRRWSFFRAASFLVLSERVGELTYEKDFQRQGLAGISAGVAI